MPDANDSVTRPGPRAEALSDLLAALNISRIGSRATLCKLGSTVERWVDLRVATPRAAKDLRVAQKSLAAAIRLVPQAAELAAGERQRASDNNARLITLVDPDYPSELQDLTLPPPVLYCRGVPPTGPAVAVVGSRRTDRYGLEVAASFSRELAAASVTVVSGLAIGIDGAAHRGALDGGGPTVAVLGCGIDVPYPRRHVRLAEQITGAGALISEFPLGEPPRGWNFPIRNRLIAALARGTLIVRATPSSGSLITARHALDLGRDVYAVPGNIFDRRSVGPNTLIRDGAAPVQHPREILEALAIAPVAESTEAGNASGPTGVPADLVPLFDRFPASGEVGVDELVAGSGESVDRVLSALLELELGGWIQRQAGGNYARTR